MVIITGDRGDRGRFSVSFFYQESEMCIIISEKDINVALVAPFLI